MIDEWDHETGQVKPDWVDEKVRQEIEYRDRMANAVDGPVPAFGTPEWQAADWKTQLASHAREQRERDVAYGKKVFERLCREESERRDLVGSCQDMSRYLAREGFFRQQHIPHEEMERLRWGPTVERLRWGPTGDPADFAKPRPGDYLGRRIPEQRTGEAVARAREACREAARPRESAPARVKEPSAAERVR